MLLDEAMRDRQAQAETGARVRPPVRIGRMEGLEQAAQLVGRQADALATAVSVMPTRDALALMDEIPSCSCCIVRRDGLMQASRGWPGKQASPRA